MPHFMGIYLHIKSTESQPVLLALPENTNITKPGRVLGRIAARWWWSWNFPRMELADFYDWAYQFLKLCRSNQSATLLINGNKSFKLGKAIRTAQLAKGLWFFIPRRYKGGFQSSPCLHTQPICSFYVKPSRRGSCRLTEAFCSTGVCHSRSFVESMGRRWCFWVVIYHPLRDG